MDFSYSDEQRMLKDMVDRLVADQYDFETREAARASSVGYSADMWRQFAELGLLGVPLSEDAGGFDGGGAELMVVAEGFGRGLVVEPYLASVVLCGHLIDKLADQTRKAEIAGPLISGETRYALACHEPDGGCDPYWIATTARADGGGYVLDGTKAVVAHGDSADHLIVIARSSGEPGDRDGLSAFLVDATANGVTRRGYPTIDGHRAADITLENARVDADALLGELGLASSALDGALERGVIYLCAEATGAMARACELTLEYLKERKQFGAPIGSFQALQHRMVDMRIALEKVRSLTFWAACSLDSAPDERGQRIAAAKVMVGRAGRHVAEEAIQLFGGMGMMEESAIAHYAKRIIMIDHWLGDHRWHMAAFRRAVADGENAWANAA
ncbi:acyl-CoA dehydrogenase family protein [Salinisphaera hydrothermalis]|uniref:Acyl-CoA dehydrogenase n=1 Tax=Salinisphaera hydrothermalis (strain C41B8) TaxID=1304275 RepID=A0A084ILS1_SALHC|nr:acyl-CoA dehydrogenase [Salinisphaera hydrothermalis]KEZ77655.1 acyl-CoA dehydrogenase [Salinisphaera hydrothermalis C41B8]